MTGDQEYDISDGTAVFIFCIIQAIFLLILCPLSLYYTLAIWRLYKKEELFVVKRRPVLVVLDVIVFNLTPLVFALGFLPKHISELNVFNESLMDAIHEELANFFDLCLFLTLARVWLLFYDYKHSAQTLSFQWEKHILQHRLRKPWALRFKFLGNARMIHSVVILLFITLEGVILLSGCIIFVYELQCILTLTVHTL